MDRILLSCRKATLDDCPFIQATVEKSWKTHFRAFLTDAHIRFDMEREYSDAVLRQHLTLGPQAFWILSRTDNQLPLGFVAIELLTDDDIETLMLHKFYLDSAMTGQGIGSLVMDWLKTVARQQGARQLMLLVNRYNRAKAFYESHGFAVMKETDTKVGESETGEAYWRNDYRMTCPL